MKTLKEFLGFGKDDSVDVHAFAKQVKKNPSVTVVKSSDKRIKPGKYTASDFDTDGGMKPTMTLKSDGETVTNVKFFDLKTESFDQNNVNEEAKPKKFKKGDKVKVTQKGHELFGKEAVVDTSTHTKRGVLSSTTTVTTNPDSLMVHLVMNKYLEKVK